MGSISRNHSLEDIICARCGDLIDITVVSCGQSDTAALWVRYLSSCFQQIAKEQNRPPFKLLSVCIEDVLSGLISIQEQERCVKARLQVWVLCPKLLARLHESQELNTIMRSTNVLALLLGVSEDSLSNQHRATLYNYENWKRLTVKDQDPTFVGDVLGISMDILSRSWQNQADSEKAHFSLIPKKIKVGQNKLIILMNEPLEEDDHVRVSVDKNGHRIEVTSVKRKNPYTLQFSMPAACLQISILATVYVEKNGEPMGHKLVKCESRMRELDQLLKTAENPLQFMCQTLGLSPGDRDQLDHVLVSALQKNIPPHFNMLQPGILRHHSSSEEYPTLLHFAAKFGLEKLCWQLLECPGGEQASQIRNSSHFTPADLAEKTGHHKLADALKGHLQMTELSSMYTYLKGISNQQGFNDSNYLVPRPLNEGYIIPPPARPVLTPCTPTSPFYTNLSSYQVPPSPIRVSSAGEAFHYQNTSSFSLPTYMDNYKIPASGCARPFSPSASPTEKEHPLPHLTPFGAYLEMQASQSFGMSSANHLRPSLKLDAHEENRGSFKYPSSLSCNKKHGAQDDVISPCSTASTESHSPFSNSHHHYPSPASSIHGGPVESVKSSSGVQDELIEIINDFKNNVLSISEVEKLVENWRSRNDVQQSFIEKQAQLNDMRKEYDRIQQSLKDKMKRPTPFERIRKFFSRSKAKHSPETGLKVNNGIHSASRPTSSLSLHSSSSTSSTGRISTGSGTSLGDSGTHSDHDDRKSDANKSLHHPNTQNHQFYSEIPFIPKPVISKSLSIEEYKNMEKRALCNSCHEYTNFRAPLLRGNSYQGETIEEENHSEIMSANNEAMENVAVAEIHHNVKNDCGCKNKTECPCGTKNTGSASKYNNTFNSSPIISSQSNREKELEFKFDTEEIVHCTKSTFEASDESNSNTHSHVIPVTIELTKEIQREYNKTVDEIKDANETDLKYNVSTNLDIAQESFQPQENNSEQNCNIEFIDENKSSEEEYAVQYNGKNRESFVIEIEFHNRDSVKDVDTKIFECTEDENVSENETSNDNRCDEPESLCPENIKTVINKFNNMETNNQCKSNKVHSLAQKFEENVPDQEDLDNSFEKEFNRSCKEIQSIGNRNSLTRNYSDEMEESLKRFDSESTLQLSDVETEQCQYDVSSYVNINTCKSTNL